MSNLTCSMFGMLQQIRHGCEPGLSFGCAPGCCGCGRAARAPILPSSLAAPCLVLASLSLRSRTVRGHVAWIAAGDRSSVLLWSTFSMSASASSLRSCICTGWDQYMLCCMDPCVGKLHHQPYRRSSSCSCCGLLLKSHVWLLPLLLCRALTHLHILIRVSRSVLWG